MKRLFSIGFAVFALASAGAQATPIVPMNSTVYRDLDALAGAGLIDDLLIGSRPYSRREVVRLLDEAKRNVGRLGERGDWAARAVNAALARYGASTPVALDVATVELTVMDNPLRGVPADANGAIDAIIDPLTAYQDGWRYRDGATAGVDLRLTAEPERHIAGSVEPRLWLSSRRGDPAATQLTVQSAGLSFLFGNLSVGLGREPIVFGQALTGGILLSRNAPALDVVRVSNERPARLPWIFDALGPAQGTAFVADLGANQNFRHVKLIGYRFAAAPHPQFEMGVQVLDEMGGNGGPAASFRDRIYDAFPIIDVLRPGSDFQFSNKFAGIDLRWRMPRWRGFQLFADAAVDDFDARRLKSTFLEDGGYVTGLSFSCLMECGVLGVRAEYHQTGIRYYTHGDFRSGIATNEFVLGDPLGPRGLGGYFIVDRSTAGVGVVTLTAAFEVRSGNRYGSAVTGANDRGFHFVLQESHPAEKRGRLLAAWTPAASSRRFAVHATAGVERADNFAFEAGRTRTNLLAQFALEVRP